MKEITREYVKNNLPNRPIDANKGTMGTLLSITGSYSMAGACMLAAKASLLSGVGLLKQVVVKSIYEIVSKVLLEPVYIIVDENDEGSISSNSINDLLDQINKCSSVLLGCGLKNNPDTKKIVKSFISNCNKNMLVDADAINALEGNIDIIENAKSTIVLTPHVLEFSRISDYSKDYIIENREEVAKQFTTKYRNIVLVLKGHNTIVAKQGELFVNLTGNPGMAKGGSGDVLSGIIASFMAQGVEPFAAAKIGVYIHGLAGDYASIEKSEISMLPSDIIENIPKVYKNI